MLVSLSVSNFRSFREEVTFSLVASKAISGSHPDHAMPIPDASEEVLKTAVLYGANGAGKSNLFRALKFAATVATEPQKKRASTGRESFRFASNNDEPSTFDLRFIANEHLYRFGFAIDDTKVCDEWLIKEIGTKEEVIYERKTDSDDIVSVTIPPNARKGETKFAALATVGGPVNQSFLATAIANLQPNEMGVNLGNVIKWFTQDLNLIGPDDPIAPMADFLESDPKALEFAGEFLRAASTGVDQINVSKTEISESDFRKRVPGPVAETFLRSVSDKDVERSVLSSIDGEFLVEKDESDHYYNLSIQTVHKCNGEEISLPLKEESDGTQRLLNLIPALSQSEMGGVYFIDEIDRSLHPMLAWKFIEFFIKSCKGVRHQIILTTHESHLLDLDLLRRDEIWFVEKDRCSATQVYSLTDFKVRKDLEIRKHYLQGRFGAVPFLASMDDLLEREGVSTGNDGS